MALINCFECNKNVSNTAKACPNCGFNVRKHIFYNNVYTKIIITTVIVSIYASYLAYVITLIILNNK